MINYIIEDNVPIPAKDNRRGFTNFLRKMEPGQSVLIPDRSRTVVSATACRAWGARNARIRTVDGGVRVWRLK